MTSLHSTHTQKQGFRSSEARERRENDENGGGHSGKTMVYQKRGFHNPDFRSGPGKPNQKKASSWTFHGGIPEQKFNVNRACFPKENTKLFTQKWAKFMNFSFCLFLWFGLSGRLLMILVRKAGIQQSFCQRQKNVNHNAAPPNCAGHRWQKAQEKTIPELDYKGQAAEQSKQVAKCVLGRPCRCADDCAWRFGGEKTAMPIFFHELSAVKWGATGTRAPPLHIVSALFPQSFFFICIAKSFRNALPAPKHWKTTSRFG